jgi:hypothetical protein
MTMQNNTIPATATEAMKARFIFHIIDAPRDSSYVYDHKTLAQILTQKKEPSLASYDEFTLQPGDEVLVEDQSYVVDSIRFRMYGGILDTSPEVGINLYGIGVPGPYNVEVVAMLRGKE